MGNKNSCPFQLDIKQLPIDQDAESKKEEMRSVQKTDQVGLFSITIGNG